MIRAWLLLIITLALGAGAAWLLRADAGYVLMSYDEWTVETSLLGLVATVLTLMLGLMLAGRVLLTAVRLPASLRRFIDRRRGDRARSTFEEGLLRLLEGNWKRAEIELVRRAADHRAAHLNYLGAARAAQHLGANDRRDHYLQLALAGAPEHEFAVLLTQAELQLERGEFGACRDTTLRLREQDPRHPYAIEMLAESFAGLQAWEALRGLLIETAKLQAIPAARHNELLQQAMAALITDAEGAAKLDQLKALWDTADPELRRDPSLRRRYAQALHQLNAEADAAALIIETLRRDWDGDLVRLYGRLHGSDNVTRLATIEQWLSQYGERADLLVTAGQACLQNKLWGKARNYLESALRIQATPTAYLALAQLCEQTQQPEEAALCYRKGLEIIA